MLCKCTEGTWPAKIIGADCIWKASGSKAFQRQVSDIAWLIWPTLSGSVLESLMWATPELEKDWKSMENLLKKNQTGPFEKHVLVCIQHGKQNMLRQIAIRVITCKPSKQLCCDLYGSFHHHKVDTVQGTGWEFVFTQHTSTSHLRGN